MSASFSHTPVLANECLQYLSPAPGETHVDCTVGGGGHAALILEASGPDGQLLGLDADSIALEAARMRLRQFGNRVTLVETYFDHLKSVAEEHQVLASDGILFDLGVSSAQLDVPERGFSFQEDAPLDMRFGPKAHRTAAELVADASEEELRAIFRDFGEERFAGRIARRITETRDTRPIQTTSQLADLVVAAKPRKHHENIHPATRVFQALRIAVNDELGRLSQALPQALDLLRVGSRLVVISFHSLEDRIVKQFIRQAAASCVCPPEAPFCTCETVPRLRPLTKRPVTASPTEVTLNPRSRSAKLRAAERLDDSQSTNPSRRSAS